MCAIYFNMPLLCHYYGTQPVTGTAHLHMKFYGPRPFSVVIPLGAASFRGSIQVIWQLFLTFLLQGVNQSRSMVVGRVVLSIVGTVRVSSFRCRLKMENPKVTPLRKVDFSWKNWYPRVVASLFVKQREREHPPETIPCRPNS